MNIALLGAFDRNNYGDLLFPIIVEKALKQRQIMANFNYYALIESNLESIGAVRTESIVDFYKSDFDVAILTGGDILPVKWSGMEYNLRKNYIQSKLLSVQYRLFSSKKESIAKKRMKGKTNFPWIITDDVVKKDSLVIYNTVGGSNLSGYSDAEKKILMNDLLRADYLSVRDRQTAENLYNNGIENLSIIPDSAVIMSEFFNQLELKNLISSEAKELFQNLQNKYLVFQVGDYYAKGSLEKIIEQLEMYLQNESMSLLLLPIGRAWGHSDQKPLEKIYKKLYKKGYGKRVCLPMNNSIYDTMFYISNSELFVGTSLHGCITAISYGKPCISMDQRVTKLNEFLKEFSHEKQLYGISYHEIFNSIKHTLKLNNEIFQFIQKDLIHKVNENFDNIASLINERVE